MLELKTVADVALVGYPSAGKSSLISVLSAAKPKIADYPFTTLVPNLGVVTAGSTVYTIADVPGLIPGASQGKGLGLEFLRHVERCSVLVHVLDCATLESDRDPVSDLDIDRGGAGGSTAVWRTGRASSSSTRSTSPTARTSPTSSVPTWRPAATRSSRSRPSPGRASRSSPSPWPRSSTRRAPPGPQEETTRIVIRPKAVDDAGFTVTKEADGLFRVRGEKPERWVRQTDFNNDEAVGYLADRLNRLGVEEELMKAGAREGDGVAIGGEDDAVVFDWEPTMAAGAEMLGRRGEDHRMEAPRPAAQRRRDREAERDEALGEYEDFDPFEG